jgi:hypothetical protein
MTFSPTRLVSPPCFASGREQPVDRSHDAVIRVYDDAGNVIEKHEQRGDFKDW